MAKWDETKEKLKTKIVLLTDNNVSVALEKREDLVNKIGN
jgi:hypothetical protein